MQAQCVLIGSVAGSPVIVPDDTCSGSLVISDAATYAAAAQNPLLMPVEVVWAIAPALLVLMATAFVMRQTRKALD